MEDGCRDFLVTLYSPGKRCYKFVMEDNEANRGLLEDSNSHKQLLAKVKGLGIQAVKDNLQQLSEANFEDEYLVAVDDTTVMLRSANPEKSISSAQMISSTKKDQRPLSVVTKLSTQKRTTVSEENDDESCELGASSSSVLRVRENPGKPPAKLKKSNIDKPKKATTKAAKDLLVDDVLDDEQLIFQVEHRILENVFDNPPLFNIKLDLKKRTPEIKQSLFNMIADSINDEFEMLKLNWKIVENTFTSLRAYYVRYTNALKLPSGSGANRMPVKPKHYEILQQNDILKDRRGQTSSLSAEGFELQPPKGRSNKSNKADNPDGLATLMKSANQYFDHLNNPIPATNKEPAGTISNFPVNCDPDVTFLLTILPSMKELPKAAKRKFQHEVMGKLNEELERCEAVDGKWYRVTVEVGGEESAFLASYLNENLFKE